MPTKALISVVIITQNEELNIGRCIRSCRELGDVIVIDSGSTDKTQEIAEQLGAKVIIQPWLGFGPQKRFGIDQIQTDWFLNLDADEYLTPVLFREIQSLSLDDPTQAFRVNRRSFFLGREVRFSGWNPDWVTRIGNKTHCNFTKDTVHERLAGHTIEVSLPGLLMHNSYGSQAEVTEKTQLYGRLGQLSRRSKKNKWMAACWAFFRTYILRLGLLDGVTGLRIASMNAKTTYIKYTD